MVTLFQKDASERGFSGSAGAPPPPPTYPSSRPRFPALDLLPRRGLPFQQSHLHSLFFHLLPRLRKSPFTWCPNLEISLNLT